MLSLGGALFFPEVATRFAYSLDPIIDDSIPAARGIPPMQPKPRLPSRNDTHKACDRRCLNAHRGNIYIQPLSRSRGASESLLDVVKRELCNDAQASIFSCPSGTAFDMRLLQHQGLILIAEMRFDYISDVSRRINHRERMRVAPDADNFVTRALTNTPRGRINDPRNARRVLRSFDLVLIGKWEGDPRQRKLLLALFRGYQVLSWSDDAIAEALGMPNTNLFSAAFLETMTPNQPDYTIVSSLLNGTGSLKV